VTTESGAPDDDRLPDEGESFDDGEDEGEEEEESLDIRRLLREVTRSQTRALVFDHLATKLVADFAAHGEQQPRMLLQLPDRGSFPADLDDILELQNDLMLLADQARARGRQLLRANAALPPEPTGRRPAISLPPEAGEEVIDSAIPRARRRLVPEGDWSILGGESAGRSRSPSGTTSVSERKSNAEQVARPARQSGVGARENAPESAAPSVQRGMSRSRTGGR
jgi:hypothetical protein